MTRQTNSIPNWFTMILIAVIGFLVVRDVRNIDQTLTRFTHEMKSISLRVHNLETEVMVLKRDQAARR